MKIYSSTLLISNTNFQGGLSKSILSDINSTDCIKIQNSLLKQQYINANFSNNKVIAWSVKKVVDLLEELRKKYKIPIFYPANIVVDDLKTYENIDNGVIYGFTNFFPCRFKKNSKEIVPGMSIIFNKNFPWKKIDEISDYDYSMKNTMTNHFLESFFHEFSHIMHEGNLLQKYPIEKVVSKLQECTDNTVINNFKKVNSDLIINKLCKYATENPLDLLACDLSGRFINNLDSSLTMFEKNPFKNSPYNNTFNFVKLFKQKSALDLLINKIYNGKI